METSEQRLSAACTATVQAVVQAVYPAYERTHAVARHVRRAMRMLSRCGTGELGTYEKRCPDGHYRQIEGRSCRHRACPRCAWRRGVQWLEGWQQRLLPGTHFHIVFTLPSQLHALWRNNRQQMAELLFAAAWLTLRDVLGKPGWEPLPGLLPAVLIALHTWNRLMLTHPHAHCLVSAGGIAAHGQWVAIEREILAPGGVLRKVFRGKFLDSLERAWQRGKIVLPPGWTERTMALALRSAANQQWNVHAEPPYRHGMGLVIYLARYVCGGPIGDRRIVSCDAERVSFVVGRERENPKTATVPAEAFVRRLCEHVAQPGQRMTRAYGLYASRNRPQLEQMRAQLARIAPVAQPHSEAAAPQQEPADHCCPVCGKPLVIIDLTPARRTGRSCPAAQPSATARGQPVAVAT